MSLGWLITCALSFKARFIRLVTRRSRAARAAAAVRRHPWCRRATASSRVSVADRQRTTTISNWRTRTTATRRRHRAAAQTRAATGAAPSSGGYAVALAGAAHGAAKSSDRFAPSQESIQETAGALESVLQDFGVRGEIINARPGPVVTLYELEPAPGIKSSRVIGLADDIARSMSALSARVAVVSGRNAIGIELPNDRREKVYLRELLAADDYQSHAAKLPLCLGKTIGGESVIVDLARMPHLLIAGTTGSGKSVAINTMILSPALSAEAGAVPADHGRSEDARALRL